MSKVVTGKIGVPASITSHTRHRRARRAEEPVRCRCHRGSVHRHDRVVPGATASPTDGTPEYDWLYGGEPEATRPVPAPASPRACQRSRRPDETRVMPTQPPARRRRPRRRATRPTPPPVARRPSAPPARRRGRGPQAPAVPAPLRLAGPAAALAGLPGRRAALRLDARSTRSTSSPRATARPTSRARRTSWSAATPAQGLTTEERKELGTGNADGPAHRHDHAAAHRLRPEPADVDPARLAGRHPRPRHDQDQRGLRVRRPEAAGRRRSSRTPASGSTTTSRSASAASSASSTRSAASRSARSSDMKDKLANLNIKKGCQEVDGAIALGLRPLAAHVRASATSTGPATSARWSRAVGEKVLSPWTFINPVRYWRLNNAVPDFFAFGEGTGPVARRAVGLGDDPGQRRERPDLRRADPDLAVHWDPERSQQMFDKIIKDDTDDIPRASARRPGCAKSSDRTSTLRDPRLRRSTTTASPRSPSTGPTSSTRST